jgi:hypothetical protein
MAAEQIGYTSLFCRCCYRFKIVSLESYSAGGHAGWTAVACACRLLGEGVDAVLPAVDTRRLRDQNSLTYL